MTLTPETHERLVERMADEIRDAFLLSWGDGDGIVRWHPDATPAAIARAALAVPAPKEDDRFRAPKLPVDPLDPCMSCDGRDGHHSPECYFAPHDAPAPPTKEKPDA